MFGNKVITEEKIINELFTRRIGDYEGRPNIWPSKEEVEKRFKEGKKLRVYLGIDPTGPDLHIGHTIPLLFLKQLTDLEHEAVLVIGDFTAQIGDPSGKDATRKALTKKEVGDNMINYLSQAKKILPKFEVRYNRSWLAKLSMDEFFNIASKISMHYMATRSMFRERLTKREEDAPFAVHEFLYPLLQGYDSVAMKIDGEVGGLDQTFNMLIGRDLAKKLIQKDKMVFATKLLEDPVTGKKMSKTEGSLISLSDSAKDVFGKVMKTIPDTMVAFVFKLCTEKPISWINENKDDNPYEFKKELAFELVRMYHGEKAACEASDEWEKVFSNKEMPSEIEEAPGDEMKLVDFITEHALASSSSEAKRLLDQGAVSLNDEVIKEWGHILKKGDIVQVGPRKFLKVV